MAKKEDAIPASDPEVIVMMEPDMGLRASAGRMESVTNESVSDIEKVLKKHKGSMTPLFGATEERVEAEMLAEAEFSEAAMPQLQNFYKVDVSDKRAEDIAGELSELSNVAAAYVKPGAEPPIMMDEEGPSSDEAPPMSPDYVSRQGYLNATPEGVDARWAWGRPGGRGQGVRIIDIEGAWRFTHEDLRLRQGGVVAGTQSTSLLWRNHGTAVLGEYSGDHNSFGVSGICDQATASAVSIFGGLGSAQALRQATSRLRAGDIILIELHRPGPRHNFQQRSDQKGYIAIEWWEDDYAAILAATRRGVIVVEAAGNGAENLDDNIYQTRASGFPRTWRNSFRRSNRDSGAIVVGAGAPPPGTHGRNHGPDRSRLDFSNYGRLIDAQGWGREVTTCGYGDLQGGRNEDLWYTDRFSGTSSASPIVVGALGSLSGMAKARSKTLTPAKARQCLRSSGAAQTDGPGRPRTQRIGNRPDLRGLYNCFFPRILKVKEFKEGKEIKEFKEFKEKDRKEFEKLKDRKEFKEKDRKEFKEKDKDKDIFEKHRENFRTPEDDYDAQAPDMDQRLASLEQAVGQLTHFISSEMRPDLEASAQTYSDADYDGTGDGEPGDNAKMAKESKDAKDVENF